MSYLFISLPFLLAGAIVWWARRHSAPRQGAVTAVVGLILLVLTAIFDNLMIFAELVGYGQAQRLGLQIGLVPIEDFFYPIFAVSVLAALWPHSGSKRSEARRHTSPGTRDEQS